MLDNTIKRVVQYIRPDLKIWFKVARQTAYPNFGSKQVCNV